MKKVKDGRIEGNIEIGVGNCYIERALSLLGNNEKMKNGEQ